MDDQNNNPGGGAPSEPAAPAPEPQTAEPASMPAEPVAEPAPQSAPAADQPQAEQQCTTCGNAASGGNCVACAQGEANCTCPPAAPSAGGSAPIV